MPFVPLAHGLPAVTRAQAMVLQRELGEYPGTIAAHHCLERAICRAWVSRDAQGALRAAVVQPDPYPEEPFGYGEAGALWALLRTVPGWTCVNVGTELAETLAPLIAADIGVAPRIYGDLYLTLDVPPSPVHHPAVRRLDERDLRLFETAPSEVRGGGFESTEAMVRDGVVAGAVIDDRLVAIAHISVITPSFEELGVATLPAYRGRGLASAAAASVCDDIVRRGKIAMWSAGADNVPSLRIADTLGFRAVGRRAYVILPQPGQRQ